MTIRLLLTCEQDEEGKREPKNKLLNEKVFETKHFLANLTIELFIIKTISFVIELLIVDIQFSYFERKFTQCNEIFELEKLFQNAYFIYEFKE